MKAIEACDTEKVRQHLAEGEDWGYELGLEKATIIHHAVLAGTHPSPSKAQEAVAILTMLRQIGSVTPGFAGVSDPGWNTHIVIIVVG